MKLPVICLSSCLAASASLIQGGHKGRAGTRRSAHFGSVALRAGQEGHNDGNS